MTSGGVPDGSLSGSNLAYAKVSISLPKVSETRATSDVASDANNNSTNPSYDKGKETEYKISSIYLALYDDFGNYVGIGKPHTEFGNSDYSSSSEEDANNGFESNKYIHVFKLELTGGDVPSQAVAYINFDENQISKSNLSTLTKGEASDVTVDAPNKFVMTNSGYYDTSSKYKVAAAVTVYKDVEAAKQGNPDPIYVERLAAKITVKKDAQMEQKPNYSVKDIKGAYVTLNFTPTYWGATGKAINEHYVKAEFTDHQEWNKADHFRSFWANAVGYAESFEYYYKDGKTTGNLEYITYEEVK